MKTLSALTLVLSLAACVGKAPPVASPDKAINQDGSVKYRCVENSPPPGYQGPVSPYSGSCVKESALPAVAPAGSHDYSQGMPPRPVR
ncbi:exported hypothetical protein [Magnetospirillum sp. LM-5]|uniref:hypothetical protein n=1 Tax=Magnetospirillum sp. LM-5 TaxID=2681466 RepID=UPI00137F0018|nr:hypothetical protein [Magnetospirillum sp. LM-5]CAA7620220.1 exported hypothetical protein [Magnetospirillum sp. LM-5]